MMDGEPRPRWNPRATESTMAVIFGRHGGDRCPASDVGCTMAGTQEDSVCQGVSSVVSDESESWQDMGVPKRFWILSTQRGTIWRHENGNGENRKTEQEVGSYVGEGTGHWSPRSRSQRRKCLSKEFCVPLTGKGRKKTAIWKFRKCQVWHGEK